MSDSATIATTALDLIAKATSPEALREVLREKVDIGLDFLVPRWAAVLPFEKDDDAISERIAMRAFEAGTVDAMLEGSETVPIEGLIGNHLRIDNVTLTRSTIEDAGSIGVYCVIEFTDLKTGEHAVTTTSAKGVMMQLANAYIHRWLPFECVLVEVDTGRNGKSNPLHLARKVDF